MPKILNLRSSKNTLLQVDGEAVEAAEIKDIAEVRTVLRMFPSLALCIKIRLLIS